MTGRAAMMLALMLVAGTACAAELGRVFFTPEQRAAMDDVRKKNIKGGAAGREEQPPATMPQNVSVNGVIRRSDGKNTIWLNNRVIGEKQAGGINAAVGKTDGRVRLSVPESGRSVDLKVGQTVEITSGTVEESYLRRRAVKPDSKSAEARENAGADTAKAAPAASREAIRSDSVIQKKTPRAAEREAADDAGRDGTSGLKQ